MKRRVVVTGLGVVTSLGCQVDELWTRDQAPIKSAVKRIIVSDSKTYGTAGAISGILTWVIAIGAVIIPGAVAGFVWEDRRNCGNRSQEQ